MEIMHWLIQTSPMGERPVIVSEYVLNEIGVFVKREKRMPKKAPLTAVTGFRVGYSAVPGTDYRAAPMARDALLWYKVTSVTEEGETCLIIRGNRSSKILLCFEPENREEVLRYIDDKRRQQPAIIPEDEAAASWICWRDDDEWEDPLMPLTEMITSELKLKRYLEPEVLEETVLTKNPEAVQAAPSHISGRPKFCASCGAALSQYGDFCGYCGNHI